VIARFVDGLIGGPAIVNNSVDRNDGSGAVGTPLAVDEHRLLRRLANDGKNFVYEID